MSWILLAALPEQRQLCDTYSEIVYWELRDGAVWHQGRKLRNADPASFEVRQGDHPFVARDANNVFHAWQTLKKIDRSSFELLGEGYAQDSSVAYYEYETSLKPLKGQSVEQFKVLGLGFARDADYAYYCGKPIRSCTSPMPLKLAENDEELPFALDEEQVYFEAAALKGVDRASWKLLQAGFSQDKKRVYYCAARLPRVDVTSWQQLDRAYSKDANNVYVMHLRLPNADPKSWKPLGGDYSGDDKQVYFVHRVVEGADPSSFKVTSAPEVLEQSATDALGRFKNDQRVIAEIPTNTQFPPKP